MADETHLALLLAAVQQGDEDDSPVDNQGLADTLAWTLDDVAACLEDAKSRSFIWGSRSGQRPRLEEPVIQREFQLLELARATQA